MKKIRITTNIFGIIYLIFLSAATIVLPVKFVNASIFYVFSALIFWVVIFSFIISKDYYVCEFYTSEYCIFKKMFGREILIEYSQIKSAKINTVRQGIEIILNLNDGKKIKFYSDNILNMKKAIDIIKGQGITIYYNK